MNKLQNFGDIFAEEESRLLAEARERAPAELEQAKLRIEAKKLARANVLVWIGHEGQIYGPFANEDAADVHAESQGWLLDDCVFRDSEEEVREALEASAESEDEDETENDEDA